jgi:hypothetical protein
MGHDHNTIGFEIRMAGDGFCQQGRDTKSHHQKYDEPKGDISHCFSLFRLFNVSFVQIKAEKQKSAKK